MQPPSQEEFLKEILSQAETLNRPPENKQPLPRQWLPKPLQLALKLFYMPVLLLDLITQKIARMIIPPPFKQTGKCKRRGNCCYFILVPEANHLLGKLFMFWQTQVNGFFLREKSPPDEKGAAVLIMGCRHLRKDGSCGSYFTRPSVCRRWPVIEYFGRPRVLKGCGYKVKVRKEKDKESLLKLIDQEQQDSSFT